MDIEVSKAEPILLAFTNDHKIEEFYLRDLDKKGVITHPLPMKSLHVACRPGNFGLSGKNIVHCDEDILKINNRHEIMHKSSINHLLLDDEYIALTTCEDSVLVNSIARGELLADLHYYGDTITALFWSNSLAISGDSRGMVNLWDINKQKIVNSNLIHASKVDYIQAYADYVHTNFYYTVSNQERRASFHDLRTYRPIKITNNLPAHIIDVQHNPTGKIFLTTEKEVQFIDVYQDFSPIGKFCGVSS